MRYVALPDGEKVPVLGMGTWGMGEDPAEARAEVAVLKLGLDLGINLIDTAEMYGEGGAEMIVGKAVAGRRDEVFIVSKVLPQHATRQGTIAACDKSLERLGTDRIDLYLLHWREKVPLGETLEAFLALKQSGKIRHYGVSNFDVADLEEWWSPPGGSATATDQVLYNLTRRGIEWALLPWCREHRLPVMAYSPIEQGRLLRKPALRRLAEKRDARPARIALAWVLQQEGVIAIPKASRAEHLRENAAALEVALSDEELAALDDAFPPPSVSQPLEML
jgi:diketogulonate reductase-like aldo/keto reductase